MEKVIPKYPKSDSLRNQVAKRKQLNNKQLIKLDITLIYNNTGQKDNQSISGLIFRGFRLLDFRHKFSLEVFKTGIHIGDSCSESL